MQAIQFLSLVSLATIVSGLSSAANLESRGIRVGSEASDSSPENGGYRGYTPQEGKGGNSNKGHKNAGSTYCEIQSTNESALKQVNIGIKVIFDGIRQMMKSSGGNRDKSNVSDDYRERAYNAFKNAIVSTIQVAAKIRSEKSSQYQSNVDTALDNLNDVLRNLFDAINISTSKTKRDLPGEIQRREDGATDAAVAVILEIYKAISRAARGDARLQILTEKYSDKSTKYIQRCISFFFLAIRKLSTSVNPEVRYYDCDSCSTSTIDDAQIRSTNAMGIQLNTQFEALFAICKKRCSDGSGCEPQQCTASRSLDIS